MSISHVGLVKTSRYHGRSSLDVPETAACHILQQLALHRPTSDVSDVAANNEDFLLCGVPDQTR